MHDTRFPAGRTANAGFEAMKAQKLAALCRSQGNASDFLNYPKCVGV
jgi:hypothetical protein